MKDIIFVGTGGFVGAVSRYLIGGWVLHVLPQHRFPISTLAVNLLGCFVIGILGALAYHQHLLSPNLRLFLFTGILGGFTTFSAFGLETMLLLKQGQLNLAFFNVVVSVGLGLLLVWLGDFLILSR